MESEKYKAFLEGICQAKDIIQKTPLNNTKEDDRDLVQVYLLLNRLTIKHAKDIEHFNIK